MMRGQLALGAVAPLLGLSEAITLESLRLAGTVVAAAASMYGAWRTHQTGKEARRIRRDVRTRRRAARAGDQVVVVDEPDPRAPERPGGGRRRTRRKRGRGRRRHDR